MEEEVDEESKKKSVDSGTGSQIVSPSDVLNTEFIYYRFPSDRFWMSSGPSIIFPDISILLGARALQEMYKYSAVLRTYAPSLSREYDKVTTHLWMRKLFGPEYHSTILKPKRNRYLLYLSITLYNDEAHGIFKQEPPCGKLPEIKDIPFDKNIPPAAWEMERQWTETLKNLPEESKFTECYLHESGCPETNDNIGIVLDSTFQFLLWLAKPYIVLLPDAEEKTIVACWVQLLCGIAPEEKNCIELKEIRNQYMQALLGYVHDLRVEGPFRLMPPPGPVPPLSMLYEDCDADGLADVNEKEAEEFLASQPMPDSGAFAYINVTGDLFSDAV